MTSIDIFAAAIPRYYKKEIAALYQIPIPIAPSNTYRFQFTARVGSAKYIFQFWFVDAWNIKVIFPDDSSRIAALLPNVTQWSAFPDFGLYTSTTNNIIGQNDLSKIVLYMVKWT
jgi:hypothetical protein